MRDLQLAGGFVALVDDDVYDELAQFKWKADKAKRTRYAARTAHPLGKVYMHRVVLGAIPDGCVCDHIDGNGLNNQRSNLRVATFSQNGTNRIADKRGGRCQTPYRGVIKHRRRFVAQIAAEPGASGPRRIGSFVTAEEAAYAYDLAATKRFGDFAVLNFAGGMG